MWALLAVTYFTGAVIGHSVACRPTVSRNNVLKFLTTAGLLGLALTAHEVYLNGRSVETLSALLAFTFACELYIFLFTLVTNSVSASLLLTIRTGDLTQGEIDRLYSNSSMVSRRIDGLVMAGLLERSSPGYRVTGRGQMLLAVSRELRRLFRHGSGSQA